MPNRAALIPPKTIFLIVILLLSLVVLFVISPLSRQPQNIHPQALPGTTLSLSPNPVETAPAAIFTVDVMLDTQDSGNLINGADITVTYDPAFLTATDLSLGDFLTNPEIISPVQISTGTVTVALAAGTTGERSGSGRLATITFTADSVGQTSIGMSQTTVTAVGETGNVAISTNGTSVNVIDPASPTPTDTPTPTPTTPVVDHISFTGGVSLKGTDPNAIVAAKKLKFSLSGPSAFTTDTDVLTYNSGGHYFKIDLPPQIQPGPDYTFLIKGAHHLARKVTPLTLPQLGIQENFDLTGFVLTPGDLNSDGKATSADLDLVKARLTGTDTSSLSVSDVNYDGVVSGADYILVRRAVELGLMDDQ